MAKSLTAGCGCGQKKRVYVVTTKDGKNKTVDSLSAAIAMVRKEGGAYQVVRQ